MVILLYSHYRNRWTPTTYRNLRDRIHNDKVIGCIQPNLSKVPYGVRTSVAPFQKLLFATLSLIIEEGRKIKFFEFLAFPTDLLCFTFLQDHVALFHKKVITDSHFIFWLCRVCI